MTDNDTRRGSSSITVRPPRFLTIWPPPSAAGRGLRRRPIS